MNQTNHRSKVIEVYSILLIDMICIVISYLGGLLIRYHSFQAVDNSQLHTTVCVSLLLFCVIYSSVINNSRDFVHRGYYIEFIMIIKFNIALIITMVCGLFVFKQAEFYSRLVFGYLVAFDTILMYGFHVLLKKYLQAHYRSERNRTKIMAIIDSEYLEKIIPILQEESTYAYEVAAIAVLDKDMVGEKVADIPIIANRKNILDMAKIMTLDEVFIYLPNESKKETEKIIMDFEAMGVICHYNIDVVDLDAKVRSVGEFAGFTVITYAINFIDYRHHMIKRSMDLVGSLVGLLVTVIFLPFVAFAIKIESKGPVLFSQERIGKNGRHFKIYKFRSMYLDAEQRKKELENKNEMKGLMFKMKDDPRVTKVGRFLRKTSIDELPQFYNVLKGDMSLVGTRPPTVDEFEKYTPYYRRRLCMTPGLTGLWQVSGRSNVNSFDDVVQYDLHYIDYWSLSLDIKILIQTVFVVVFGRGAK
ncbi:MAG TPA: sugar transferase [Sedimentibacter sp.]|nr:sugar transferase [Sedimentibacter sp.]